MHKKKLQQIRSSWRRIRFSLYLAVLLLINWLSSNRARIHWIGYARRARRPERGLTVLLFASAWVILEPYELALWAITSGGACALFLLLASLVRLAPRKRYHWINKQ